MPKIGRIRGATTVGTPRLRSTPQAGAGSTDGAGPPSAAVRRPAKSARLATWQTFAETVGIDPTGMTKADIMAAVAGVLGEDGE